MKKEERERLQRQRLEEMKKFETEICGEEAACIAGVDEAGRGPQVRLWRRQLCFPGILMCRGSMIPKS